MTFQLPLSGDIFAYLVDASYNALDAASISRAEIDGREKAWSYLFAIRSIPGYESSYLVSTGPNFGTRQSRTVNAQYQVREDDVRQALPQEDVVALGSWPPEYHPSNGGPIEWKTIKDNLTFDIPLRALSSIDTANLFAAGRLVDGDRSAGSAMRVMGTSFATGQAACLAAALHGGG